jgi:hypothetical protein
LIRISIMYRKRIISAWLYNTIRIRQAIVEMIYSTTRMHTCETVYLPV